MRIAFPRFMRKFSSNSLFTLRIPLLLNRLIFFCSAVFFRYCMFEATVVEAAGIEPASRDIFMKASTRVVDCLILARVDSNRQDANRASRKQI